MPDVEMFKCLNVGLRLSLLIGIGISLSLPLAKGHEVTRPEDTAWARHLQAQSQSLINKHQRQAQALLDQGGNQETPHQKIKENGSPQPDFHPQPSCGDKACPVAKEDNQERYPRLLVFVSFAMPDKSLQQYARDCLKLGGKLVVRGLIENSFQKTAHRLKDLGVELLIDPTLFRTYKVEKVPTIVLTQGSNLVQEQRPHDKITGHVSLAYALKHFSHQGEVWDSALLAAQLEERQ